jgi:hypothetical protein
LRQDQRIFVASLSGQSCNIRDRMYTSPPSGTASKSRAPRVRGEITRK